MTDAERQSAGNRGPIAVMLLVISAYLIWMTVDSAIEIIEINDYEVFYHIGAAAAEHDAGLYELVSPVKKRGPFLYPPSSAILFSALTWVSYDISAVLFTAVKIVCLVLLLWGSVRWSGARARDLGGTLLAVILVLVAMHRSIDSDIGNGQINIVVAALGVGGMWLMMLARRQKGSGNREQEEVRAGRGASGVASIFLGPLLLALSVAIKLTPLLLLAVPFLHRRWKSFASTLIWLVLLLVLLPLLWFGPEHFRPMAERYTEVMSTFMMDSRDADRQVTLNEMIQFSAAQWQADPDDYLVKDRLLHQLQDGRAVPARLPEPMSLTAARTIWLICGLATGAIFLVGRWLLFRRRDDGLLKNAASNQQQQNGSFDWAWDLAVLCVLMIFLSPQVRKAHLVILIVPVGYVITWIGRRLDNQLRVPTTIMIFTVMTYLCLLISEDLPIPVPSLFPQPYYPMLFFGLLSLLTTLVLIPLHERPAKALPRNTQ